LREKWLSFFKLNVSSEFVLERTLLKSG